MLQYIKDFLDKEKRLARAAANRERALARQATKAANKANKKTKRATFLPLRRLLPPLTQKFYAPETPEAFRVYGVKHEVLPRRIRKIIYFAACDKVTDEALTGSEMAKPSNDFYYAYYYDRTKRLLKYIALPSSKDLSGKCPNIAYALVNSGKYYLEFEKGPCLLIDSTDDNLSLKMVQSSPVDDEYQDLNKSLKDSRKLPKSCSFAWAKQVEVFNLNVISLLLLAIAFMFYWSKHTTLQEMKMKVQGSREISAHLTGEIRGLPNLTKVIQRVADHLRDDNAEAAVEKIELKADKLTFYITFSNATEAQVFAEKIGGQIENDKVIFTAPVL